MNTTTPLKELRGHLSGFSDRCRGARWFGALFHVGVCEDTLADAERNQRRIVACSFTAEQADLEAEKIIQAVLRDDVVTTEEIPRLKAALRNIHRSARADHDISEMARV